MFTSSELSKLNIFDLPIGIDDNSILNTFYLFSGLTFTYSLPRILSYESMNHLDRLLFSVVLVAFISQIYTLTSGIRWIDLFKDSDYYLQGSLMVGEGVIARTIFSPYIILYSLIRAFFHLFNKTKYFSNRYINLIIFVSCISIFLSATRGWILALLILLLLIFITYNSFSGMKKILSLGFISISFFFITILIFPSFQNQLFYSFERLETVEKIINNESSDNLENYRLTHRAPEMLKFIYEKPILGWGFSKIYWNHKDEHIGNLVVLMNVGIIGFLIFLLFFIKWLYKFYSLSINNIAIKREFGHSPKIFSFGLIFIFIVHCTSHVFWGFSLDISRVFVIALLFASYNSIILYNRQNKIIQDIG